MISQDCCTNGILRWKTSDSCKEAGLKVTPSYFPSPSPSHQSAPRHGVSLPPRSESPSEQSQPGLQWHLPLTLMNLQLCCYLILLSVGPAQHLMQRLSGMNSIERMYRVELQVEERQKKVSWSFSNWALAVGFSLYTQWDRCRGYEACDYRWCGMVKV